jgi:hypothetical protein
MVVGFYVHKNMDFVISERVEDEGAAVATEQWGGDAGAIDGAYEA